MSAAEILPELVTTEQVAAWLAISPHAVRVMRSRGEIPERCAIKIGARLRFDAVELRRWIAEKRGASRESAK